MPASAAAPLNRSAGRRAGCDRRLRRSRSGMQCSSRTRGDLPCHGLAKRRRSLSGTLKDRERVTIDRDRCRSATHSLQQSHVDNIPSPFHWHYMRRSSPLRAFSCPALASKPHGRVGLSGGLLLALLLLVPPSLVGRGAVARRPRRLALAARSRAATFSALRRLHRSIEKREIKHGKDSGRPC